MGKKDKKNLPSAHIEISNPDEIEHLVIAIFKKNQFKAFSIKQIAQSLHVDTTGMSLLKAAVYDMVDKRILKKTGNGRYKLSADEEDQIVGRVDMTSSGTAYVVVEGRDQDIFIDRYHTGHALNGDTVSVALIRQRRNGAYEGEIVKVLERNPKNYVGVVESAGKYAFVIVGNKNVPQDIFVPVGAMNHAENGDKVVVKITEWPDNMKNPVGEVLEVLGKSGENNTEMHAILAEYDLPYKFTPEVEKQANAIPDDINPQEVAKRRDLRGVATFTIDPADAKDFDDALSYRRLENGHYEVGVHIADVTHYVVDGPLEEEACSRATSVYLVDRTVPMLPERLSNELCSLRPNEDKLCFSVIFEMDDEANILDRWIGRTVIRSVRRFAYEEAQQVIETGQGDLVDEITTLDRLAKKLRAERFKNGSVNFERAEAKFVLDDKGKPLSVYFKESKDANKLIEEFMLLANRNVAEFVGRKRGSKSAVRTFVYRIHDKPNEEKFNMFRSFIVKFGYYMKADKGKAVAKEINRLMSDIHGKAEENLISTLAIRSMAKAVYSTDNIGHYGLAFDYYTHFTSPIRRYPDMMVHRLLQHYLDGGKSVDKATYEELCEHSSEMEQRAADAERASIKYKMVEFMEDKIGEEFDGAVSGVTEWGVYVELKDTMIEGMVSLRDISDDYYMFDEDNYCVVGRVSGNKFTLGDRVRIRVKNADLKRKLLDFEMVGRYDFETGRCQRLTPESEGHKHEGHDRDRNNRHEGQSRREGRSRGASNGRSDRKRSGKSRSSRKRN